MANEKLASLKQLKAMGEAAKAGIDAVKATVPKNVSDLINDNGYQTAAEVNTAISSQISRVYKPGGTLLFAELPELTAAVLGNVYDIKEKFTTTANFREGAGKKYPAGTNVVVVQDGDEYKFDVLSGEFDLSGYVEKDGNKTLSDNNYSDEDVAKLESIASGATKVEASEEDGKVKINGVDTTVVEIASDTEAAAVINQIFPAE